MQAGIAPVVASCGTALTPQQAQLLRRFTSKVVLSFDPDAAGEGAAVRSCELLVAKASTSTSRCCRRAQDPDTFVRTAGPRGVPGAAASVAAVSASSCSTGAAAGTTWDTDEGRRTFLHEMLAVAARIPDAAARDQFADRLAHKARITEDVVRAEIRKAAVARKRPWSPTRELPPLAPLKAGRTGPDLGPGARPGRRAGRARSSWKTEDLERLAGRQVLEVGARACTIDAGSLPSALLERLNERMAQLVTGIAAESAVQPHPH